MNTIKVEYQGALQQKITHLPSGQTILTDGPAEAGGKATLAAPTDLLASAFASCAMTIMALQAERMGADFSGCYAESGKEVSIEEFRVSEINITFYLKEEFSQELREVLESAATDLCIVGRSLSAELIKNLTFVYQ